MLAQNDSKQITRLAAQRQLYKRIKYVSGLKIFVSSIIAIIGFWFAENPDWKVAILLSTISFLVVDFFLIEYFQKKWKGDAARIQEMFDTDVFKLSWDTLRAGKKLNEERIMRLSDKFNEKESLKNWYPDINPTYNLSIGRLICQRSTIVWELELRSLFADKFLILLIVIIICLLIIGINLSILKFFTLIPLTINAFKYRLKLNDECENLQKLANAINDIVQQVRDGKIKEKDQCTISRDIQGMIFDHRKNCTVIFDFFYWRHRNTFEHTMQETAKTI